MITPTITRRQNITVSSVVNLLLYFLHTQRHTRFLNAQSEVKQPLINGLDRHTTGCVLFHAHTTLSATEVLLLLAHISETLASQAQDLSYTLFKRLLEKFLFN